MRKSAFSPAWLQSMQGSSFSKKKLCGSRLPLTEYVYYLWLVYNVMMTEEILEAPVMAWVYVCPLIFSILLFRFSQPWSSALFLLRFHI